MITTYDIAKLRILSYPDLALRKVAAPIDVFGEALDQLAEHMYALMHAHRGVGLAGPQVGLPFRIFVWNPTGEPDHDQVFINPRFLRLEGQVVGEEGCLSIEAVNVNITRASAAEITAQRPDGSEVTFVGEGLVARIWQHEIDHLDGRLILDYMSPADEIANRRAIKDLEAKYRAERKIKRPRKRKR
jgi:peptide deformylase